MNSVFNFNYTPDENKELNSIRSKYTPHNESKMDTLRALDRKVKRPANTFSYIFGALSALVMGAGMSLTMTNISGLSSLLSMLIGIPVGLVGIVLVVLAYPVYRTVLKKARKRIAPEIIRLSDELLR